MLFHDPSTQLPRLALACDVGNSRVKFGLFRSPAGGSTVADSIGGFVPVCVRSAVFRRDEPVDWSLLSDWVRSAGVGSIHAVVAGTNPRRAAEICETWDDELVDVPVRYIQRLTGDEIPVLVDEPQRVGIDRVLNAIAADALRPPDCGVIVVDSGTATTVDVVDVDGAFRGGAILPGFELAAWSLHDYTALLPNITIEQLAVESHAPLGANTRAAIRSGLFWGQVGAVNEIVRRLQDGVAGRSLFGRRPPQLLLTGGGADLLAPHFPTARREPYLSMQGLVLAAANPGVLALSRTS